MKPSQLNPPLAAIVLACAAALPGAAQTTEIHPMTPPNTPPPLYLDPARPADQRVADLLSRMTLE